MFHRLSISSQSNLVFRCQQCKSILFNQKNIDEYIKLDRQNLGQLKQFSSYNKATSSMHLFSLSPEFFISTFSINYDINLLINTHPCLKMYMFEVKCTSCKCSLGYIAETFNINTLWMKDRILIDAMRLMCIIEDKNQMKKIIKRLESRLVKKINQQKQQLTISINKENQRIKNKLMKMAQILVEEEKILREKQQREQRQLHNLEIKQMKMISCLSTLHQTNYIERPSSSFAGFTNFNSIISRSDVTIENNDIRNYALFNPIISKKPQLMLLNCSMELNSQEDKLKLVQSLWYLKGDIIHYMQCSESQKALKRIFTQINRLQYFLRFIDKKMVHQVLGLQNILTYIRHKIVKPLQQLE